MIGILFLFIPYSTFKFNIYVSPFYKFFIYLQSDLRGVSLTEAEIIPI